MLARLSARGTPETRGKPLRGPENPAVRAPDRGGSCRLYPSDGGRTSYSVIAQTLAGSPLAPSIFGHAAISTAPAGAT